VKKVPILNLTCYSKQCIIEWNNYGKTKGGRVKEFLAN